LEAGQNVKITGMGSSQDPFVVEADVALEVSDNETFDIGLGGNGTREFPWLLEVDFADTASINDLPDVEVEEPEERNNGDVLGWNATTQRYEMQPPTTAAAGSVLTDGSLDGDGSAGDPLQVRENSARYITTGVDGVGLSDAGMQRLVRRFTDAAARDAMTPAPEPNSLSILDSRPGVIEYWDGTDWLPVESEVGTQIGGSELLALSGEYDGGRVIQYVEQISLTTAPDGTFDVLPTSALLPFAGVLSVSVQPMGNGIPWSCMAIPTIDRIVGKAVRLDTGAVLAGQVITASVTALLY
jgi:hypothetical protein